MFKEMGWPSMRSTDGWIMAKFFFLRVYEGLNFPLFLARLIPIPFGFCSGSLHFVICSVSK